MERFGLEIWSPPKIKKIKVIDGAHKKNHCEINCISAFLVEECQSLSQLRR